MDVRLQSASPTRRVILLAAAGVGLASLAPPAFATSAAMEEAIRGLVGKAVVSTRIRLADSQQVVAIARLGDGSFWSDSADVIVTLAACAEG